VTFDSDSSSDADDGEAKSGSDSDDWEPEGGFQNDEEWSTEEDYTDEDEEPDEVAQSATATYVAPVRVKLAKAPGTSFSKAGDLNFDDDDGWDQFSDIKFK